MNYQCTGPLAKMPCTHKLPVEYALKLGDNEIPLNALLGRRLTLNYLGSINCHECGRRSNKSFAQGYCYPCFKRLPQCDTCMVRPETCHYAAGSCRDEAWAERVCMNDHIVYLANSSSLKVGITRATQVPVRWMDQGASAALPMFRVSTRRLSGLIEVLFKEHVSDRTNWQAMLKGEPEVRDLRVEAERLKSLCRAELTELQSQYPISQITELVDAPYYDLSYPVDEYPLKVKAFNFDKAPEVTGVLKGVKGQYLIFDTGVLNVRKFTGYQVGLEIGEDV